MNASTERGDPATSRVSAVVCTHDHRRWGSLVRAVQSLRSQTLPLEELIIVVDHDPDLLVRVRREIPDIVSIPNGQARGLSGARNSGLEVAQSPLVAFLDDDATARADWIARLAHACRSADTLGAGGRVLPRWLKDRPRWFPDEFLWVVGCTYRGMPTAPRVVRNVYGGCFCLRREVFEVAGGFRTELGRVASNRMGCEETELCIRAARRWPGRGFFYDPLAIVEHDVEEARTSWNYFQSRCFAEGLSKAVLTKLVGPGSGLSSERSYATRALPAGIARELAGAMRQLDPAGAMRSGAIAAGFGLTAAGYAAGITR